MFLLMARVIIVGAGISGLALAYRLHQISPALDITILEQRSRPGGTMWTERHNGFQVEVGPNGFLDNTPSTIALCRDVGLSEGLLAASETSGRNRYLLVGDRLHRLPHNLVTFLQSELLSWRGKLSIFAERFRFRRRVDTDESIASFARRRVGREAADLLADAFVTGIYAGDAKLLSVRSAFPRLKAFEAEYGSVLKGMGRVARQRRAEARARGEIAPRVSRMWSFAEGLRLLIESLAHQMPIPPLLGVNVRRLQSSGTDGSALWTVCGEGHDCWSAEAVILTCPAVQQASLLGDFDSGLANEISGIAYNRVAVVALGYRTEDIPTALDGFGFIVPQQTRRDILGVQWCSSIFPERAPPGHVLLRAMCGGWNRPEIVDWDDARLMVAVRAELRQAMRIEATPVFQHIVRWERAIPQYHVGHLERVIRIRRLAARYSGLFLGGNAYEGVAVNDCTEQAEKLALAVKGYLDRPYGAAAPEVPR
jgi:oxygen-dependent protoporphyrinogen oxidase